MFKSIRRTIAILLIMSLVYANVSGTIFGIISFAIDDEEHEENSAIQTEEVEPKALTMEITEFCKNNMQEQVTEYREKLNIELSDDNEFDEIVISDITSNISDGVDEEPVDETIEEANVDEFEQEKNINIFYKATQINKEELINAIGKDGKFEIICEAIEENIQNEQQENIQEGQTIEIENLDEQVQEDSNNDEVEAEEKITIEELDEEEIEKGIINIENNLVKINSETEANEEGIITIIYPENVTSVEIKITTEVDIIEKLEIVNTRVIETVEDINEVNLLQTTKQIVVKGEEEIINIQEVVETPINYTMTKAELGVDRTELSNIVGNKVNFTITMLTSDVKFDLYKNPYFIIELPSFIENISIDNILILNNPCFEIKQIEQEKLENGNKVIVVTLEGEQLEYTKSNEENIQIIVEATLMSNELMPTMEKEILLHYFNESAKTYDGIGDQVLGIDTANVTFVSNKEIIVETKATVGEKTVTSFKEQFNSIVIEPNTYNSVAIAGTVVNNTGENIQNAKILGTTNAMSPITGIKNVYYTLNVNATADLNDINNGWTSEYTQSAKKYLIVIENFEQAHTLTFGYTMYMPERVENDAEYEEKYEIYNTANEVIATSKIDVYQEAERLDTFQDETIIANVEIEKTEGVKVGDYVSYKINIGNISGNDLKNMSANIELPHTLKDILVRDNSNNEGTKAYIKKDDNQLNVVRLSIAKDQYISIEINARVEAYSNSSETVKATINYGDKQTVVSNKMKVVKPSTIETIITSDKNGKTLEANEEIEYKITLYNNGESNNNVNIELQKNESVNIQKIEAINLTTGKINKITSGDLMGTMSGIDINQGETVEIYITCKTKELKKDSNVVMYALITGSGINEITTNQLLNEINKKHDEIIEQTNQIKDEKINDNVISGIAWVDKNEDGVKDKNEIVLKNVQATLINTVTGKEVQKIITNNDGKYAFENVDSGTYIVEFNYNTDKFSITEYKNEEVSDDLDSDVVNTTQDNKTVAKTEVISMQSGKTENVNIGLVLNKKFDISINKGITKVTVNNKQGTAIYDFDNSRIAKVEIDGEYLKGSLVIVQYKITVRNDGEIAGYVRTISDEIPEGMKFNSEFNPEWYQESNGELYSKALADKELQPGETATISLILTKEMTDDKIITPVNKVTIQEVFNNYLIEDTSRENDKSEATIIISLTTGKTQNYMWLVITVIAIIGLGVFGVLKITIKNSNTMKERRK